MPSIKDINTVKAIAREYCSNGRNKGDALRVIGYKESYCTTRGIGVVYSNERVQAEIEQIEAEKAVKIEHNRETSLVRLDKAYTLAEKQGNTSSSSVSAWMILWQLAQTVMHSLFVQPRPSLCVVLYRHSLHRQED